MPPRDANKIFIPERINIPVPAVALFAINRITEQNNACIKPVNAPYTIPFDLTGLTAIKPTIKPERAPEINPTGK